MSQVLTSIRSYMSIHDPTAPFSRILVLYTGGTIGMKKNKDGRYVPEPGFLYPALKQRFDDSAYTDKFPVEEDEFYLYPMENGRRIRMKFIEYSPLIDSSNMKCENWIKMANSIKDEYEHYDGFVVLHGTDTMAYTVSALAFICYNLGKPIILTGSQIPVVEIRSDGYVNFVSSLVMACSRIPEVMLCFDYKVYRGCRTVKDNAEAFAAFVSPNMAPLGTLGVTIEVDYASVRRPNEKEVFSINTNICPNVAVFHLIPSMTTSTLECILKSGIRGLVIHTYGAGNAPNDIERFIPMLKLYSEMGIIIANVTQCLKGSVAGYYAVAEGLQKAGVIPCGDMTLEAAVTKLMFVLGQGGLSLGKKRKMMSSNIRGEITILKKEESALNLEIIDKLAHTLNLSTSEEIVKLRDVGFPNFMCAAAKRSEIETLKKLKNMGGDLSFPNQDGRTPLHVASREGLVPVVKFLLKEGASVHQRDSNNNTPLMDAIYGNRFDVIPLLIRTGATIHIRNTARIATELCRAADLDDVDSIRSWYMAGADLNYSDYDKRTALHVATSSKSENVIEYLLSNAADANAKDQSGKTPRYYAEKNGLLHLFD